MRSTKFPAKPYAISFAAAAIVACLQISASATTFYVSESAGNDSASGKSATEAWKTLERASADQLAPGDKVLLKAGDTWNEEFHPKGSGTAANPITIASFGQGDKPVIDRGDYNKDLFGIHLSDQGGYKIVGIEFNRCMTGIYGEYAGGAEPQRSISIEDCYFHDSLKYGHYEDYPAKKIGLGICFFSHETKNSIVLKDVTIKNCVFRRLASGIWTNNPDNFNQHAGNRYNFANFVIEDSLFEEGHQWQQGMRGVDGGAMRHCITHDIGRNNRAFNGVAGAMFSRCKNWVFEDSEWGYISIGPGGKKTSGDGEAFDFESNCDHMTMRNCLFHDTDGPGFLLCDYASGPEPETDIHMENCVLNGKANRTNENRTPKCEIINTTDFNEVTWKNCRFYLSKGEILQRIMDTPEKEKKAAFTNCVLKNLSEACATPKLMAKVSTSSESAKDQPWVELDFSRPTQVTEFKIKEDPSSAIIRYAIEYWDEKDSKWVSCFNGRNIGPEYVAPIVARPIRKARLLVLQTTKGTPKIAAFEAYDDTTGEALNMARGGRPKDIPGK